MIYVNKDSFCSQYRSICGGEGGIISLARTTNALLNKSGKFGYYSLVPDFKVKIFSLSPFSRILTVGFSCMYFIRLIKSPSNLCQFIIITRYWILTNAFSVY